MNEFISLIFNPITIIALILAVFFILMGLLRRAGIHRQEKELLQPSNGSKPYHVANPYAPPRPAVAPAPPAPTLASASLQTAGQPGGARKYFRQFGPAPDGTASAAPSDPASYVWE